MANFITLEQLCSATGLSRYKVRYYQQYGYFEDQQYLEHANPPVWIEGYDPQWVEVWKEVEQYMKAGLDDLSGLELACKEIFKFSVAF
jgi:hypothetical protein